MHFPGLADFPPGPGPDRGGDGRRAGEEGGRAALQEEWSVLYSVATNQWPWSFFRLKGASVCLPLVAEM